MYQIKDHPLYRKHNIDSAMSTLWEFYKSRFLALFLISLVISGVMQLSTFFVDFKDLGTTQDPMVILEKLKTFIVPLLITAVAGLLFSTVFHYYILHKPLDSSCNIFVCILRSLKYFIPYLIIVIILAFAGSIAIVLGLFVLFVGMFFAMLYVGMISLFILPVMMAEEGRIDSTISRTIRLSHANFWPNMGWTAVFIILYIIISMVLSGIVLLPFAGSFVRTVINPQDTENIINLTRNPVFLILSSAVNALTQPLLPIFAYIIYFNGRAREEEINLPSPGGDSEFKVKVEDLYAKPRNDESSSI